MQFAWWKRPVAMVLLWVVVEGGRFCGLCVGCADVGAAGQLPHPCAARAVRAARAQVGLQKLAGSAEQVSGMQAELQALQPQLIKTVGAPSASAIYALRPPPSPPSTLARGPHLHPALRAFHMHYTLPVHRLHAACPCPSTVVTCVR